MFAALAGEDKRKIKKGMKWYVIEDAAGVNLKHQRVENCTPHGLRLGRETYPFNKK